MTEVAADALPRRESHPRRWLILGTILAAESMEIIDGTIVNVAIPAVQLDLSASSTALQWIVGGYALAFAVGLIASGRLGDIYGRKRMFMLGIVAFTLTSLACGLAPSSTALIVARLAQGLAAAIMIPQGFGMIREAFSDEDLPKAFAFWGPILSIGGMLGPILGGLMLELNAFDTDWRGVFLVNIPIGIAALYAAWRILPSPAARPTDGPTLDLVGAALMSLAIGLIFFALIQGREQGWPEWIFGMLAAGLAVLAFFAWFERRREVAGKATLIVTSIFRKPAYVSGTLIATLLFAGYAGLLLTLTLYIQVDQDFSPIHAGLTLVPWSLGAAIGAAVSGRWLVSRMGRSSLQLGTVINIGGIGAMLLALDANGHSITSLDLGFSLLVQGLGLGILIVPLFNFVLAGVADEELGSASGLLAAMQQLGAATGIAVVGTIFFAIAESDSMLRALEISLIVVAASLVIVAALICLLPKKQREDAMG